MNVSKQLMLRVVSKHAKESQIGFKLEKDGRIGSAEGTYELKIWCVRYGLCLTRPAGIVL